MLKFNTPVKINIFFKTPLRNNDLRELLDSINQTDDKKG